MRIGFRYRYKKPIKSRFIITFSFITLCFFALTARLFFLQIARHSYYRSVTENSRTAIINISPARGLIFDKNMNELAVNVPRQSVYAIPRYIRQKELAARNLSIAFNKDKDLLLNRISGDNMFVWVARKLPDSEIQKIKEERFDGIGFVQESERSYPNRTLAAHVLGFVDIDNNGLEGIEKYYDSELRGVSGYKVVIVDAKRRQVNSLDDRFVPARNGHNIVLSIDSTIQHIAEKALLKAVKKYNPKSASAVVMDPSTGDILALCNWPLYDLNDYPNTSPDIRKNRAITDMLEPGSAFKIVTASAVLEEQAVTLEDEFYCENGSYKVAGRVLHDHRPHGMLKFKNIIELSSNIGTVKAAQKLGAERLYNYVMRFGFGRKTGIGLPGESAGIVRHISRWSKGSIFAIPIGHEIATTTIQLAAAISCIANDGILIKPRIVLRIVDSKNAVIKRFETEFIRRVISKETCDEVKDVLRMVVESGTGKRAAVPGYNVAGKTGTAQRMEEDGSYSHTKFNAVFLGFAPVDDPKLAIAVVLVEPKPQYYGGTVAAPVFSDIAGKTLKYMGIPMTEENEKRRGII